MFATNTFEQCTSQPINKLSGIKMTKQLPETLLSGLIGPYESLNAIGKVMEFIAGAAAALSHDNGEALDSYGEGLHYLTQHLADLQLHAVEQYAKELSEAKTDLKRLADFEQLHKLYRISKDNQPHLGDPAVEQGDDKLAAFKSDHALQIMKLEKTLFPAE